MIRAAAPRALAFLLLLCILVTGCAAPGEPTARHPVIPAAVTDLGARQYGNSVSLTFTLPTRSTDHEALAEHPGIEIYRASLAPGGAPDKKSAWRLAYTIPPEQVDRYLKGEQIEFRDLLRPEEYSQPAGSSIAYKIQTRAAKARASEDSNVVTARIYPAPEAPRDVRVEVTEPALIVSWADVPPPPGASSRVYRIYRGILETGVQNAPQDISQKKLKGPLEVAGSSASTDFRDSHFEFGTPYVYTVRAVAQFGAGFVESSDSSPVAITPRDIFPPAAPMDLEISLVPATPQSAAYVELSWAISPEVDLAGYAVYRSDQEGAPGERISTEALPTPAFRDISVQPGNRYYYRVTALDRSGNESPKSSAVVAQVP